MNTRIFSLFPGFNEFRTVCPIIERDRVRHRETGRDRERDTRDRERQGETQRDRERQTETG